MKRPFYGERINTAAIAGLCFAIAFSVLAWCAIVGLVYEIIY